MADVYVKKDLEEIISNNVLIAQQLEDFKIQVFVLYVLMGRLSSITNATVPQEKY